MREMKKLGILRKVDRQVFGCFVDSIAKVASAQRKLEKLRAELLAAKKDPDDTLLIKVGIAVQQSPLLSIIHREKGNIQRFAAELGMSPTARARLQVEEGAGDEDLKYEDLLSAPNVHEDDDDEEITIQ